MPTKLAKIRNLESVFCNKRRSGYEGEGDLTFRNSVIPKLVPKSTEINKIKAKTARES